MTIARSLVCATVAAGLLAACSQPSNTASSSQATAAASAAPASGPDTVITENDLPHPKAGEWAMSMSMNGAPVITHQICESGQRVDIKPQQISKDCSKFQIKRTFLGGLVVDMACSGPMHMNMTVHSEVKGDFNESYVSDTTASMTMQGQPARSFVTHTEAHYVGPCTSGATG